MKRRLFLKDFCSYSISAGIITSIPSTQILGFMNKRVMYTTPHEFDAWEDEFQALRKKKDLDKVIQQKLGKTSFGLGEGKYGNKDTSLGKHFKTKPLFTNNIDIDIKATTNNTTVYEFFNAPPSIMNSPYSNIYFYKNKDNNKLDGHQGFRTDDNYEIMFFKTDKEISKNYSDEYLMIHPIFNQIIANKKWFCYGIPVEQAVTYQCSECKDYFFAQLFGYKSNNPIKGNGTEYYNMVGNLKCSSSKWEYHNGIKKDQIAELTTCTCYENIKPQISSGNL
jgi:hypothetical protein